MVQTSWIQIDLTRLADNLSAIRRLVAPAPAVAAAAAAGPAHAPGNGGGSSELGRSPVAVCGVVKADGYGLGAVPVARRLVECGIDMLAVYSPAQAEQLIEHRIERPILILMPVRELPGTGPAAQAATRGQLHLSLHDEPNLDEINRIGRRLDCQIPVHLHLDTGMSRTGLSAEQLSRVVSQLDRCPAVRVAGLYTHFAAAEDDIAFTNEQMDRFERAVHDCRDALPDDVILHAANTFATHRDRRFHLSMVRVGLGLYGYGPQLMTGPTIAGDQPMARPGVGPGVGPGVRPTMCWVSRLVHCQRYPAGADVGYNRTHRLQRDSLLGVVPVGYGDGYPLSLLNRSAVGVIGDKPDQRFAAPVLGKVNMDQIVIDLTDAASTVATIGQTVELISDDDDSPCALHKLAEQAGSSCYEMLCRLPARIERKFV